jgi:hypothetical protein
MSVTEERLREKLEEGAFYDYNQLLKTLFFKLKMRKREQEYQGLMKRAMEDLRQHNQVSPHLNSRKTCLSTS